MILENSKTKEIVFQKAKELDEIRYNTFAEPINIKIIKPLDKQDSTYLNFLKSRTIEVKEIHLSPEGDITSSEDGKFILEKKYLLNFSVEQEKAIIPESVITIDFKAFTNSKVKEIIMPDTIEVIDMWAFADCKYLEKVRFSQNLRFIGSHAFFGCQSLNEIDLPDSLEIIKNRAFEKCYNLKVKRIPKNLREVNDCNTFFKGCQTK